MSNHKLLSTAVTDASKRKPKKDAEHFKTDTDTGKMIIDESDEEEENAADAGVGDVYKESITGVDGFTRGPNGRVKFNKDTKKRRREELEDGDVEMDDVQTQKPLKKQEKKFGQEFKAKVRFLYKGSQILF
jgi:ribosomal RNA-processing protein 12